MARAPRSRDPSAFGYALFLLVLLAGYAAILLLLADLPWVQALWQGAVCVLAIPLLLFTVLHGVGVPKTLRRRLPGAVVRALDAVGCIGQFVIPWLGWSALLLLVNGGALPWPSSVRAGAPIAGFSYLLGLAVVMRHRTRPSDVVLTRVEVPISGLPRSFDGYQIMHLSDLHASWWNRPAQMLERIRAAAAAEADLVVFTGDLAASTGDATRGAAEALSRLRGRDGAAAVLGNHDRWIGGPCVIGALAERGIKVLINQPITVHRGGALLHIAGVDDPSYTRSDDLAAAFEGIPEGEVVILLSHAPSIVSKPLARRAALVLAGHTHGGQVVLPWFGPIYLPPETERRHASGLHQLAGASGEGPTAQGDGQWLFVTRGLGEVLPPMRIACPPEIALVTLRTAM